MPFFTEGRYRVSVPSVRVLLEPSHTSKLHDQAIMGEKVEVLDANTEFAHVRVPFSGNSGWISDASHKLAAIGSDYPVPTHRVRLTKALTFRMPDAETETMVPLPLNAQVAIGERQLCNKVEFARVLGLTGVDAWIRVSALMEIGKHETDFVEVLERMLGICYVWGARDTTLGVDCSRALGESLRASGQKFCPGDTKDQVTSTWLGTEMHFPGRGLGLLRGDLIFWKGHVVTMVDDKRCIHATDVAPHHRVLIQPLHEVMQERLSVGKGNVTTVRRFERYRHAKLRSLVA